MKSQPQIVPIRRLLCSSAFKPISIALFALCLSLRSTPAQEVFLKSDWLINVGSPAASIWAGGNESSGTTNDSPYSANGICLAESAIGQITAQIAGYPNADNDLATSAASALLAADSYQYTDGQLTPAIAWNVVFPGGFDPSTGQTYPADSATNNYVAGDIALADYDLRASLAVNPGDTNAAQQLVLLVEAQMLPLEWAGSAAMAYSTYARLSGMTTNNTNVETIVVGEARGYFQGACGAFSTFLANPFNAALVEGQIPNMSDAVTNPPAGGISPVARIVEDYMRNLSEYAEASLTYFQLLSMANFYDPTLQGSSPSPTLLSDIDSTVSEIQMRLALATPFQSLPVYTTSAAGQIKGYLHDLRRLHQSIVLGRITFNTGASGTSDPSLNYGEYTTAFVPIFSGLANPGNSSFDVAIALAQTFTEYATNQEITAFSDVVKVLQLQYTWASDQQNLQNPELLT